VLAYVWVAAAWFWPSWRTWLLCLAGYVANVVGLHAVIVVNLQRAFQDNYGLDHWLNWGAREAPRFLIAAAVSALIVWLRLRWKRSQNLP